MIELTFLTKLGFPNVALGVIEVSSWTGVIVRGVTAVASSLALIASFRISDIPDVVRTEVVLGRNCSPFRSTVHGAGPKFGSNGRFLVFQNVVTVAIGASSPTTGTIADGAVRGLHRSTQGRGKS